MYLMTIHDFTADSSLLATNTKVKVQVKLFLHLNKHHTQKTCEGGIYIAPHILNLGTRWR